MNLFSNTFSILERGLDYSSLREKTIAQNIANVDTPNYKAKDVSFKSVFASALDESMKANRTDQRHFEFEQTGSSSSAVTTKNDTQYNQNGNNVDMDKEMTDLATNQIYYNALAERLSGKFTSLQNVIKGGK